MDFQRYVWALALIRYFSKAKPPHKASAVLDAMSISAKEFEDARVAFEEPMLAALLAGESDLANDFGKALATVTSEIAVATPSLDEVREQHRSERKAPVTSVEETAMARLHIPRAALPFKAGGSGSAGAAGDPHPLAPSPADGGRGRSGEGFPATEETLATRLGAVGPALPWATDVDGDNEATLMKPSPFRRGRRS